MTVGSELEGQLLAALCQAHNAPAPGARSLPVLTGLYPGGRFSVPQDNVILAAAQILSDGGRVYLYGNGVFLEAEAPDGTGLTLKPLTTGAGVEAGAEDLLANLFRCQDARGEFPVPRWFAEVLLRCDLLAPRLPRVAHHARRPVFDADFVLRGPGWHPGPGILVHGPGVEPAPAHEFDLEVPAVERLPQRLRTLLGGFCFRGDADVANAVAMLLTGLLANRFVRETKPVFLIDGNQPGLGKTLLARVAAVVLDGAETKVVRFTPDEEELQKTLCAALREGGSVLLIDNAKVVGGGAVSSPTVESATTAPEISLRILGTSSLYSRPNDVLWMVTMNDTRTSPDLVSRGVAIQMYFEGDPRNRTFACPDPVRYAREHRLAILGELAGMVVRWNQAGRPDGLRPHRCREWGTVVGGILELAGLPEFLGNADEAAASFDVALEELAALAEAVIEHGLDPDTDDEE